MKTIQKNFRVPLDTAQLLADTAKRLSVTETDVVNLCIAAHAMQIGDETERATKILLASLAKNVSDARRKNKGA